MNPTAIRVISGQHKKYQQQRSTIDNPAKWISEYGYYLIPHNDRVDVSYALLVGPKDTPYVGAILLMRITFPNSYPYRPPLIENMLKISNKFNANLWGSDQAQSLMCSDGKYKTFYGLICMDILNTPHATITSDSYGNMNETYDSSKEQYTPIINLNGIFLSMRSHVLSADTKISNIDDEQLQKHICNYMILNTFEESVQLKSDESNLFESLKQPLAEIFNYHQTDYDKLMATDKSLSERWDIIKQKYKMD